MSWDACDLLKGGEQNGKDLLAGGEQKGSDRLSSAPRSFRMRCTKPDPLDYGDPIAYAEAETTYRHCTEDAAVIELPRCTSRAPDVVIELQITLQSTGMRTGEMRSGRWVLAAVAQ
jgi:hypothetical protein